MEKQEYLDSAKKIAIGYIIEKNNDIEVEFYVEDEELKFNIKSNKKEDKLNQNIIKNLSKIAKTIKNAEGTYDFMLDENVFGTILAENMKYTSKENLTTFEVRMLAHDKLGKLVINRNDKSEFKPKTDLHTHFAGILSAEALIEIGLKNEIKIPKYTLERCNIDLKKFNVEEGRSTIK